MVKQLQRGVITKTREDTLSNKLHGTEIDPTLIPGIVSVVKNMFSVNAIQASLVLEPSHTGKFPYCHVSNMCCVITRGLGLTGKLTDELVKRLDVAADITAAAAADMSKPGVFFITNEKYRTCDGVINEAVVSATQYKFWTLAMQGKILMTFINEEIQNMFARFQDLIAYEEEHDGDTPVLRKEYWRSDSRFYHRILQQHGFPTALIMSKWAFDDDERTEKFDGAIKELRENANVPDSHPEVGVNSPHSHLTDIETPTNQVFRTAQKFMKRQEYLEVRIIGEMLGPDSHIAQFEGIYKNVMDSDNPGWKQEYVSDRSGRSRCIMMSRAPSESFQPDIFVFKDKYDNVCIKSGVSYQKMSKNITEHKLIRQQCWNWVGKDSVRVDICEQLLDDDTISLEPAEKDILDRSLVTSKTTDRWVQSRGVIIVETVTQEYVDQKRLTPSKTRTLPKKTLWTDSDTCSSDPNPGFRMFVLRF